MQHRPRPKVKVPALLAVRPQDAEEEATGGVQERLLRQPAQQPNRLTAPPPGCGGAHGGLCAARLVAWTFYTEIVNGSITDTRPLQKGAEAAVLE